MALLRLLHLPSATDFSSRHYQILSPHLSQQRLHKPSLLNHTPSYPSLSLKLPLKSQRFNLYQFHVAFSTEAQPTTENPESVEEEEEEEEFSKTRILAQNVPWTCTVDDVRSLFEKYGTVVDIELSMYNKTRNRGLAFVTMGSQEEALDAFSNLESYEYEGRVLKLNWAKPRKIEPPPPPPPRPKPLPVHNLYVANVPFKARSKDLKEFFNANNGNVVSAEIIFEEKPRRSAGYGFVSFSTKEDSEVALSAFQGKEFMGRPIRVAHSKKFLRAHTKADIELGNDSAKSESLEKADKPDAV